MDGPKSILLWTCSRRRSSLWFRFWWELLFLWRVYICARKFRIEAEQLGGFLFLFLLFFILCVTSFLRVLLKINKINKKVKESITHARYYEHFFARTLRVASSIAREEKETKGVKVESCSRVARASSRPGNRVLSSACLWFKKNLVLVKGLNLYKNRTRNNVSLPWRLLWDTHTRIHA